jgi:PQQ-like domain
MDDSTQNNRADRIIANQSGPQYANEGDVYANTGDGPQIKASDHAQVNSGSGSGHVYVGGSAGDIATSGGKIVRRKFRFSPLVLLGHAAKTHPVASVMITLIVGAGAVSGGYVLTHAKGTTPEATPSPTASTATATASPRAVVAVPLSDDTGWPQLGGGPARTGYQPGETRIGSGNVTKLVPKRTYPATSQNDTVSAPLIANSILYVDVGYQLDAFDATGATGCVDVPTTCTPLWTASTPSFEAMTVGDGDVFVTGQQGIEAFAAAASTANCSGTPKVCSPQWTTSMDPSTAPTFMPWSGSPVVANGVLYVPGYGNGTTLSQNGAYVAAFDPRGTTDCSGTPVVCQPMWTTTASPGGVYNPGPPAIANGDIYITVGSTLYAFDATESASCTGTPKKCAPLWTATMSSTVSTGVIVADGVVYVGTDYSGLYAFGTSGTTNCSTTTTLKTCQPLLTAPVNANALAIANGVLYAATTGALEALNAAVPANCPGTGAIRTCSVSPLWTSADSTSVDTGSVIVANGVVYVTSGDGGIDAYDAAGSLHCSVVGTAKTCTPLWHQVAGSTSGGSPAIVNGVLYVNGPDNGDVYAFSE